MTDRTLPTKGHASRVMPPVGPEMDALVGEILGWLAEEFAHPSTYAYDAWCALDEWREQHPGWAYGIISPYRYLQEYRCELFAVGEKTYAAVAPTLESAICEAIIRAHWALEDAE